MTKKNPSALLGAGIALVVLLCCGGIASVFGDDEETAPTATKRIAEAVPTVATAAPTSDDIPEPSDSPTQETAPKPAPKTTTSKSKPAAPYYKNCDAVRAADDAPLLKGEPGYRPGLDRDGDGEACEPDGGNGDLGGDDDTNDDVYYANCTAVRAAGAAPIHRGEPGYSRKLDRDGDGVACE